MLFVGFDDSVTVGLRSPSNSFGHPTDKLLAELEMELRRYDNATAEGVTKIVYGHYPMSFTTSTESGKHPEDVMASNDVTAYLCGHLHTKFGRRLYRRHTYVSSPFCCCSSIVIFPSERLQAVHFLNSMLSHIAMVLHSFL